MNFRNKKQIIAISAIGFFLSLQLGFTLFIDSSYLSKILSRVINNPDNIVGYIFASAFLFSLVGMLKFPKLLRRFGVVKVLATAGILLPISLLILFFEPPVILAIIAYFIITVCDVFVLASNDILLPSYMDEENTGLIHGIYFAIISLGFMISPAIAGYLVEAKGLSYAYLAGVFCTFFISFITYFIFKKFKDGKYEDVPVLPNKKLRKSSSDLMPVFWSQFALQAFYAIMTVYAPIYFVEKIGIGHDNFGYILTIALSTFVIMPTFLGYFADKFIGEKEMIITGMLLMSGSLIAIPILARHPQSLIVWGTIIFISRIGATMTESMTDAFFFKKIEHAHPSLVSFYRRARPLAYLSTPAACAILLSTKIIDISQVFLFSGLFIIVMIFQTYKLIDTK